MDLKDIYWLAGLVEGEGTFAIQSSPFISLEMIDKDVIERAAILLGSSVRMCTTRPGKTQTWGTRLYGEDAIGIMYMLYSLMGRRRKEQITECIREWRSRPLTYKNGKQKYFTDSPMMREILLGS